MRNIDQFNEVVGKVFARLYQSFPVKIQLDVDDFMSGDIQSYYVQADMLSYYRNEGEYILVKDAINFLIEEGFITCKHQREINYSECRLTNKGFVALGAIPDSLSSKETIGDKLIEMSKDSAIQQGKESIGSLVKVALSCGASYITGS